MSIEIKDLNIVKGLLDFYEKDFIKGVTHPRTNEVIYLGANEFSKKIDCLNFGLFNPEVILVWGSDLAFSQLEIWAPLLKKSKLKHAILCKSLKGKNQSYAKLDNVPIFAVKEGSDTKFIANYSNSISSMLYMTDKNENFGYMRAYPNLLHVAAHHGDSDKHASFNRLFGAFDYLLVADKNSMNRYLSANIQLTSDHFLTIGNSIIEGVEFQSSSKIKNILFAPTFEGHGENVNYSSLMRTQKCFDDLNEHKLMLRPHPGTGLRNKSYKEILEVFKSKSVDSLNKNKKLQFNWSDILICDISGILSEYIFTGKPIIVPVSESDGWLYKYINNLDISDYVYLWDYNSVSLKDILQKIEENDVLKEKRIIRRNELFCGVESLNDSIELYEKAMMFLSQVKFWRDLKNIKNSGAKFFVDTPSDPVLKEVVEGIRSGKYLLKIDIL